MRPRLGLVKQWQTTVGTVLVTVTVKLLLACVTVMPLGYRHYTALLERPHQRVPYQPTTTYQFYPDMHHQAHREE